MNKNILSETTEFIVRFSEADPLGIAWHGSYVRYFEDGREAFGKKYDISYLDILEKGYITPVIKMSFDFKQALKYNEEGIIETTFIDCEAAKVIFNYKIYRKSNHELVTTGETIQVFLTTGMELNLTIPEFFLEWKKRWGLINE